MKKDEEDNFWTPLNPVKKARYGGKHKPTGGKRYAHYQFCGLEPPNEKYKETELSNLLDEEADEWLYRLFKPTTEWTKFQPPWVKKERKK